ncbi:energy transducer TonB [Saccharicrinis sp. FJH2]|uniref:energy transducer TonB n=1 Tax=Saccharicrinis sp. FJH65 TaxID=3344659 RepID=UPI0035F43D36
MKVFYYILTLITLSVSIEKSYGTAQIPDFLIYKGDTLSIYANPLESYFDTHPRPDSLFDYNSTSCWRGYIGYWELKNDSLFLINILGDSSSIDLSLIFHDRDIKNKIFADWYDYSIYNPYGKLLHYEHMGYSSIYEFEREFVFSNGILKSINYFDNSKSKKSKYTQDKNLLIDYIKTNTNHSLLPDTIDKARVFVQIIKVSKTGQIDSVSIVRGFNDTLDKEALRVVKSIPEWHILYNHGEPFNLIWTIPVIFDRKNE